MICLPIGSRWNLVGMGAILTATAMFKNQNTLGTVKHENQESTAHKTTKRALSKRVFTVQAAALRQVFRRCVLNSERSTTRRT